MTSTWDFHIEMADGQVQYGRRPLHYVQCSHERDHGEFGGVRTTCWPGQYQPVTGGILGGRRRLS